MRRTFFFLVPALLVACGGDDDLLEIPDGPLEGVIGGQDWAFASGTTDSFLSDGDAFWVSLLDTEGDCGSFGDGNKLLTQLPTETGEYELGLSQNVTFVVQTDDAVENLVATEGVLRVDDITDTTVEAAIVAEYDDSNSVGGSFTVTICEQTTYY